MEEQGTRGATVALEPTKVKLTRHLAARGLQEVETSGSRAQTSLRLPPLRRPLADGRLICSTKRPGLRKELIYADGGTGFFVNGQSSLLVSVDLAKKKEDPDDRTEHVITART